jgi:hypothetical protein
MRPTTLILVLLLTGFVLFLAGWFRPQAKPTVLATTALVAATAPLDEAATINVAPTRFDASAPSVRPPSADANVPAAQTMENRIAELETLALNDDTNSLSLILVALADANPEIREAALESTVQFGSPDAIPTLQFVLTKTDAAEEKVKIQDAIEFLKLPPLATSASPQP